MSVLQPVGVHGGETAKSVLRAGLEPLKPIVGMRSDISGKTRHAISDLLLRPFQATGEVFKNGAEMAVGKAFAMTKWFGNKILQTAGMIPWMPIRSR